MPFFKKQNNQLVNYSEPSTAEGIAYDNTASGLTADNVQDAVDEINTNKQDKTDNTLATTAKTIVGAINELVTRIGSIVSGVSGVKGNAESTYRTGNVNITPSNIGLGNVNNTADADKSVANAKKWNGYTADMAINNTTDTWVPVIASDGKIQHREIPANAKFTDTVPTYSNVTSALGYVPNNFLMKYYTTGVQSVAANASKNIYAIVNTPNGKSGAYVFFNSFNGMTMLSLNAITWSKVSDSQSRVDFWVNNHNSSTAQFTISYSAIWY